MKGDLLTAIDGVTTDALSLGEIIGNLRGNVGTATTLTLLRAGSVTPLNKAQSELIWQELRRAEGRLIPLRRRASNRRGQVPNERPSAANEASLITSFSESCCASQQNLVGLCRSRVKKSRTDHRVWNLRVGRRYQVSAIATRAC
jgi:hypothetical protein